MQTSTIAVDHGVVLDNIYAFLLESGYVHTLRALQLESKRPFTILVETSGQGSNALIGHQPVAHTNVVPSASSSDCTGISSAGLRMSIMSGRWDDVLSKYLVHCTLPQELLFQLYEHVFQEMLHVFQLEPAARTFFLHSPVFKTMKRRSPAQHTRLAQMLEAFKPAHHPHHSAEYVANVADVAVPTAFLAGRRVLAEDMCRVLRFVDKDTVRKMNRLPWLVAADAAALLPNGPSHTDAEEDARSPSLKKHRPEALATTSKEQPQMMTTIMAEALMHQAAECPLLPRTILRQCSFASEDDPGETITSCRCIALPQGNGAGELGGPMVAVTKTNGAIALCALEGSTLIDPFVHFNGGAPLCVDFDEVECDANAQSVVAAGQPSVPSTMLAWLAVGYRGGAVRVYDCDVRKLVRKFEGVDALGVHHLTFCGAPNVIRGHRGLLLAATLSGSLQLLSVEQGAVLKTIPAAHQGGHILSVARCVLVNAAVAQARDGGNTLEVFITCGDDGTLRQWSCNEVVRPQSTVVTTLQPYPAAGNTTTSKAMALGQLHPMLEGTMASMGCGVVIPRRSTAAHGGDWLAVATRCGKIVVYSLSLMLPLVACALDTGVASMDVTTTNAGSAAQQGCLLVSTNDGLVHAFHFDPQVHAGKRACTRDGPDATCTAIADVVGGKVAGLVVSASWDRALGTRQGAFAVCSPETKTLFVLGTTSLEA